MEEGLHLRSAPSSIWLTKKYFNLYLRNCKFFIFRVNFKMHEFAVEADFLIAH